MEVELIEIRDFLAEQPPFDRLPGEALDNLPKQLTVRYLRRGTPFPPPDAASPALYIVRSGAIELRSSTGELVTKYGEGDLYTAGCLEDDPERQLSGATTEDSLFYLLPCPKLLALREAYAEVDDYFAQSVSLRLRRALSELHDGAQGGNLLSTSVGELVSRTPVAVEPGTSLQEAARRMTRERVSSLLVMEGQRLVGILTDRDLRSRCLAEGLSAQEPVSAIMSRTLHKVSGGTPGFEALISMSRLNIHHLPVIENGEVVGVISTSDLVRQQSANAIYLVGSVRKCSSREALVQASAELPELQLQLVSAGASAQHIGQAISSVTDAITQRLLELGEELLGAPPVTYAWLAGGSQGRREQTVVSDQDNALLLSDEYTDQHAGYFQQLARFVNDGLNACGFYYCPGEVMASNPLWRQPYRVWRRYFHDWITEPAPKAVMLASNFFDLRVIHGDEKLYAKFQCEILRQARDNKIFMAYMVANALKNRPPLGFFRNFVLIGEGDHANTFDLKLRGIMPIIDIARIYILLAGIPEKNTLDRLRAAGEAHSLSAGGAADLIDAYEFIATLRVRHQARQIKEGLAADNFVAPEELSALERSHLKDAFSIISTIQSALEQSYQSGRFY